MLRPRRLPSIALCAMLIAATLLAAPAAAQDADVSVIDFAYDPYDVIVRPGDTVSWTNDGATTHTVTDTAGTFDALLQPGEEFSTTVEEEGEVNYFCRFHGAPFTGQNGYLTVVGEDEEAPEPRTPPMPEVIDLPSGEDNVDAAIAWTSQMADDGAPTVVLGRDDDFADLLAAGASGLPLLLTPTDSLDDRVLAELERLGTDTVHVVGGTAAVSDDVVAELEEAGLTPNRIAGDTRIETAVAIAAQLVGTGSAFAQPPAPPATPPGALIARAFGTEDNPTAGFADSLGAAAAGAVLGVPVLVTAADGLSSAVEQHLVDSGVGHVAVIGGDAAVPDAVVQDLTDAGITADRVAGPTRDATAAALKRHVDGVAGPLSYDTVAVVDGFGPDAWAQGFGAAAFRSVVLLSNGDAVPDLTQDELAGFESTVLTTFIGAKDVVCAPGVTDGACGAVTAIVTTVFIGPHAVIGILEGGNEVDPGSPVGNGIIGLAPSEDGSALCWAYEVLLLEDFTGAHIHRAPTGENGDIVIPLSTAGLENGETNGCLFDLDPSLVEEVLTAPGDFYGNIHTSEFPAGAVRDNLFAFDDLYVADLSGDQEVPGPGAPMAGGVSFLTTDDEQQLCHLTIAVTGEANQAAHVHTGGPDEAGPVLIPLTVSPVPGVPVHADCIEDTDPDALEAFLGAPGQHYVNIHTETFPDGAVRGQTNLQYSVPS